MTREEAIEVIKSECYVFNPLNFDSSTRINTALDVAVKALEQEPVIDKARAEIEKLQTYKMFVGEKTVYVERDDVLAIIDKYKAESGDKE